MIYMMIYIEWHNNMNENRKKHQSLLLREIGSDLGLSSPPSCLLFDMVIKKPNTRTPGLKLAYHYQTDSRPHIHAYRPQLLCSKVFLKARFTLHSSISVISSWLYISSALKSSQTRSKKFSPINRKDLGMAYHTLPLKKVKKQGEMPLPSLCPIPSLNSTFFNGMGPRLGNGISICFFTF